MLNFKSPAITLNNCWTDPREFHAYRIYNYKPLIDYIQGCLKATVHNNYSNLNNLSYSSVTPYFWVSPDSVVYIFHIVE
jgi:hypothetical protein